MGAFLLRYEGERAQHVFEFLHCQLIEPGHPTLQASRGVRIVCARQSPRQRGDHSEGGSRLNGRRDRQSFHDRRRDVRRDAQPHEIVKKKAVEQSAEKMLRANRKSSTLHAA